MSKRKGLSLEGKRDKVLEVFTESADVFVLKVRATRTGACVRRAAGDWPKQLTRWHLGCWHAGCREAGIQEGRGAADDKGSAAGAAHRVRLSMRRQRSRLAPPASACNEMCIHQPHQTDTVLMILSMPGASRAATGHVLRWHHPLCLSNAELGGRWVGAPGEDRQLKLLLVRESRPSKQQE